MSMTRPALTRTSAVSPALIAVGGEGDGGRGDCQGDEELSQGCVPPRVVSHVRVAEMQPVCRAAGARIPGVLRWAGAVLHGAEAAACSEGGHGLHRGAARSARCIADVRAADRAGARGRGDGRYGFFLAGAWPWGRPSWPAPWRWRAWRRPPFATPPWRCALPALAALATCLAACGHRLDLGGGRPAARGGRGRRRRLGRERTQVRRVVVAGALQRLGRAGHGAVRARGWPPRRGPRP